MKENCQNLQAGMSFFPGNGLFWRILSNPESDGNQVSNTKTPRQWDECHRCKGGGGIRCKTSPEVLPPSWNSLILSWRRNRPRLGPVPKPILAYHSAKPVSQHQEFPSLRMGCRKPKSVTSFLCLIRSCLSQDTEIKAPCVHGQINQFRPPNNGNSDTGSYLWVLCFHVLR